MISVFHSALTLPGDADLFSIYDKLIQDLAKAFEELNTIVK